MPALKHHVLGFLVGLGVACGLGLATTAAWQQGGQAGRYDGYVGLAPLQIVDRQTNTLYVYHGDGHDKFALRATLDLSQAGQPTIRWKNLANDEKAK